MYPLFSEFRLSLCDLLAGLTRGFTPTGHGPGPCPAPERRGLGAGGARCCCCCCCCCCCSPKECSNYSSAVFLPRDVTSCASPPFSWTVPDGARPGPTRLGQQRIIFFFLTLGMTGSVCGSGITYLASSCSPARPAWLEVLLSWSQQLCCAPQVDYVF